MFSDFEKLENDPTHVTISAAESYQASIQKLRNLIRF